MLNMDLESVISITGGQVCHGSLDRFGEKIISRICYDSRNSDGSCIFVPIVGEKVDAHRFIPQVLQGECCASFTEKEINCDDLDGDKILIRVDSSISAVQRLAEEYRKTISVPVIGITGSVGKTTTREMIRLALSADKRVYATQGNKNSQIGTPDTILGYDDEAEICVFEMGMSMPGEMKNLAAMVRPETAVFTNIGVTHIENLGSREAILEEKLHITDYMHDGDSVIVNNDNDMLKDISLRPGLRKITYGLTGDCDVYAKDVDLSEGCPRFTASVNGKCVKVALSAYGIAQIYNALAALAAADLYGTDLTKAAERLAEFRGYRHRHQIHNNGKITVIDDTYNAAPDSMKAALDMLSTIRCDGRRIAVLADMKELGSLSDDAHIEIGKYAKDKGNIDLMISYGPLAAGFDKGFDGHDSYHTEDPEMLLKALKENIRPGDLILFKGSNSMGLFDYIDKVMNYEFM